ncbi:SpoIIIAH-like family protein [Bacillaceae bacterium Marseille-Q3522]|nr:SpoIIIAH-like family protein [Bacillaceae bacterium Marseille-Q3522]
MLLKKQTVWLLTMLSLVVVLSVYYIQQGANTPSNNLAALGENQENSNQEQTEAGAGGEEDVAINSAGNKDFETLRLDLEDKRSKMQEELTNVIATTSLPAEERNEAKEKINELNEIAQKESVLETLIKAMDYDDVLVRAEEDSIRVIVKGKEHSPAAANEIIQLVSSELEKTHKITVDFIK